MSQDVPHLQARHLTPPTASGPLLLLLWCLVCLLEMAHLRFPESENTEAPAMGPGPRPSHQTLTGQSAGALGGATVGV